MRKVLALLFFFGFMGCAQPSKESRRGHQVGHLARTRIPAGWKEESRKTFSRDTLFDYINGGAERFLKWGFERLYSARYTTQGKDELTLDLYDMGSAENARAVMNETRLPSPTSASVCDAALTHEYGLVFRTGRIYGEISLSRAGEDLKNAARVFAEAVCGS